MEVGRLKSGELGSGELGLGELGSGELELGGRVGEAAIESWGRGSWGVPNRDTTPHPRPPPFSKLPTPTPLHTFRVKSSSHQVVTYPFCHVLVPSRHKLSCTQHTSPSPYNSPLTSPTSPTHFPTPFPTLPYNLPHHLQHFLTSLPSLPPHPNTLSTPFPTLPHAYPLLPQTPTFLKNYLLLVVGLQLHLWLLY